MIKTLYAICVNITVMKLLNHHHVRDGWRMVLAHYKKISHNPAAYYARHYNKEPMQIWIIWIKI